MFSMFSMFDSEEQPPTDLSGIRKQAERATQQAEAAEAEAATLRDQKAALQTQLERAERSLGEAEAAREPSGEHHAETAQLRKDYAAQKEKLDTQTEQLVRLQTSLEVADQQLTARTAETTKLHGQLQAAKAGDNEQLAMLQDQLAEAIKRLDAERARRETAEAACARVTAELETQAGEFEAQRAASLETTGQLEAGRKATAAAEGKLAEAEARRAEAEASGRKAVAESQRMEQEVQTSRGEREEAATGLASIQAELTAAREEKAALVSRVSQLETAENQSGSSAAQAMAERDQAQQQVAALQEELALESSALELMRGEAEVERQAKTELIRQVAGQAQEIQELSPEHTPRVESCAGQQSQDKKEVEKLEQRIGELEAALKKAIRYNNFIH
eukprot:TRINITY_DN17765_c0_g1_i1.p1 TRINITY_DN17765_c0_g1~~TRINITY_DN17765_c0_g1_i1.p1  ORF type:complete len:391 (-),score=152.73 TRINITY_DN17765_c0_g1_i1:97-1269(-)